MTRRATFLGIPYVLATMLWWIGPPGPTNAAGAPTPPSHSVCGRCHTGADPPVVQPLTDPACAECHLPQPGAARSEPLLARVAATERTRPSSTRPTRITSTLVAIPGGEFTMGNDGRGDDGPGDEDERPAHRVTIHPFRIDQYETTNAMYDAFIHATHREPPFHWITGRYPDEKADHPVVYVSWHDADAFCRWAGKRLPTEAEWERAARSGDGRRFPWGDEFAPLKANTPQYWLTKHAAGDTLPVGSFPQGRTPDGVEDMAGNVYEWVADWYQPYPGNHFPNVHYGTKNKVLRGGSWYDCLSYGCGLSSPAYNRSRFAPEIKNKGFGFRCAK